MHGKQQHRHDRYDHRHPAEDGQHAAGPVDRAREVHQSSHQAQPERPPWRLPRERSRLPSPPAHGKQQWDKRDPGKCRMTVARKTEREQRS